MEFGGPVWHVSVADQTGGGDPLMQEDIAFYTLEGYGDAEAGTWTEMPTGIFHLRRRLSPLEAELVGPVIDVRGTPEAARRLMAVEKWVRQAGMEEIASAEALGY